MATVQLFLVIDFLNRVRLIFEVKGEAKVKEQYLIQKLCLSTRLGASKPKIHNYVRTYESKYLLR